MLVGLVVFGFIIAGLAAGTELGFATLRTQDRTKAQYQDLEPVDRLLRRLVGSIVLPNDRALPGLEGQHESFVCITQLPDAAGAAAAHRIDAVVATDPAHRLVLRWTPHVHAERLLARPPPRQEVLLDGVERIEVSYLSPDHGAWLKAWTRLDLPALIRIRLVFPRGDPRRWPAIVAASRQTRPWHARSGG